MINFYHVVRLILVPSMIHSWLSPATINWWPEYSFPSINCMIWFLKSLWELEHARSLVSCGPLLVCVRTLRQYNQILSPLWIGHFHSSLASGSPGTGLWVPAALLKELWAWQQVRKSLLGNRAAGHASLAVSHGHFSARRVTSSLEFKGRFFIGVDNCAKVKMARGSL